MSCPCRVSSATVIVETSDESLRIMIIVLPKGGSAMRSACGRITRRMTGRSVMPIDCAASIWPLSIASIPARKFSA